VAPRWILRDFVSLDDVFLLEEILFRNRERI
jgi:hypothetical protein